MSDVRPWERNAPAHLAYPRAVDRTTYERVENTGYVQEMALVQAHKMARRAMEDIVDIHDYIDQVAGGDQMLESSLRRIEDTYAYCASLLVAKRMGQ